MVWLSTYEKQWGRKVKLLNREGFGLISLLMNVLSFELKLNCGVLPIV